MMRRFDVNGDRNPMVPYPMIPNQNTISQDITPTRTIIAGYSPKTFRIRVDIARSGVFEEGIVFLREDMDFYRFTPEMLYRHYRMILDESYIKIMREGLPAPMMVEAELAKADPYSWTMPSPAAAINAEVPVAVIGDIDAPEGE
jgi:hypothetical protein